MLRLRHRRRQFPRFSLRLETHSCMTPVTEWFVLRMTAPAKRDHRSSRETECVAGRILNNDVIPKYAIRSVVDAYNLSIILISHQFPPLGIQKKARPEIVPHGRAPRKPRTQHKSS